MGSSARHICIGCRDCLCKKGTCGLGGGASIDECAAPAFAFVLAGTHLSKQTPRRSKSFNKVARLVGRQNGAKVTARLGWERLLPERTQLGEGKLRSGSVADGIGADEGSKQFGAAPALGEVVDVDPVAKTCTQCQRSKPIVDFEKTIVTLDGRTDECRACLAAVRAMRARKPLHHLALSVEESWERAKTCSGCGLVKEFRDFSRRVRSKDGTYHVCRACHSDVLVARRRGGPHRPADEPQRCCECLEVKDADQFFTDGGLLTGRKSVCRICYARKQAEQYQAAKEVQIHIWKATRRCRTCQQEKPRAEFYRRPLTIEGLASNCIACFKLYDKLRSAEGEERRHLDG